MGHSRPRNRQDERHAVEKGRATGEHGFSLIEAVVAIFILTIVALGLGQVLGMGMATNATSDEITQGTALATSKLEELRGGDYDALIAGGALDEDLADYSETIDQDGDGTPDFTRRWQITDQTGGKLIQVRTASFSRGIGNEKVAIMATVVADPDDGVATP